MVRPVGSFNMPFASVPGKAVGGYACRGGKHAQGDRSPLVVEYG